MLLLSNYENFVWKITTRTSKKLQGLRCCISRKIRSLFSFSLCKRVTPFDRQISRAFVRSSTPVSAKKAFPLLRWSSQFRLRSNNATNLISNNHHIVDRRWFCNWRIIFTEQHLLRGLSVAGCLFWVCSNPIPSFITVS